MRFIKATDCDLGLELDLDDVRGPRFIPAGPVSDADLDGFGGDLWDELDAAEKQRQYDREFGELDLD